jgi:3-dehydroquinate synthase
MQKLLNRDPAALAFAIARSCQNKADVVATDERESGERALLNLGHTFGHAIENAMGYGVWLHGEAVATGMCMAADFSCRLGMISPTDVERVVNISKAANLPVIPPALGADRYLNAMGLDKKVENGKIRFVLFKQLGQATICGDYDMNLLREMLP